VYAYILSVIVRSMHSTVSETVTGDIVAPLRLFSADLMIQIRLLGLQLEPPVKLLNYSWMFKGLSSIYID